MLTFKMDVQLNDNEDWVKEGTKVRVSDNPFHLNRYKDSVPVIIEKGFTYEGKPKAFTPSVEWFSKSAFKELV